MASQDADTTLPALLSAAGLGLKPHPWDLLRHTFASHFVMSGGSLVTLQKILGHTDLNKTLVYAHLLPDVLYRKLPKRQ